MVCSATCNSAISKGTFVYESFQSSLDTKNNLNYAAGARVGYLVAPDALTYFNGGYSHANFTGGALSRSASTIAGDTKFDGWFVGGGLENSLNFFGINAPGWFLKTEYRYAQYDNKRLNTPFDGLMIKPSQQTVSTQLVYRFNSAGTASAPAYTKAPTMPVNWTGFYLGGGGGYGMFDSEAYSSQISGGQEHFNAGGHGYFGTVSGGYDWQVAPKWVVGLFGDAQFGDIKGNLLELSIPEGGVLKNNQNYAAGVRLGYLVAPNVLTYVNAGYSHADFKGITLVDSDTGVPTGTSLPAFHRDGYFIGSGFENSLNLFGINAPGWFMKSEYRLAVYDRVSLPEPSGGGLFNLKPYVQTITGSLVYRFN